MKIIYSSQIIIWLFPNNYLAIISIPKYCLTITYQRSGIYSRPCGINFWWKNNLFILFLLHSISDVRFWIHSGSDVRACFIQDRTSDSESDAIQDRTQHIVNHQHSFYHWDDQIPLPPTQKYFFPSPRHDCCWLIGRKKSEWWKNTKKWTLHRNISHKQLLSHCVGHINGAVKIKNVIGCGVVNRPSPTPTKLNLVFVFTDQTNFVCIIYA